MNFRSVKQLGDLRPNLIQEAQLIEGIGGFNSQSFAQIRDNRLNQLESNGETDRAHHKPGHALFNRVD